MEFGVRDAQLIQTKALPNGAGSTSTDGFDLGHGSKGDFLAPCELLIEAPALATADLGDADTMKYSIEHDTDPAFGTAVAIAKEVLVQTGAGGAGAAAASARFRLPSNVNRYVRVKATNSDAGDASDKSFTVSLMF